MAEMKWTENAIISEIVKAKEQLGIETFPTHSELTKLMGDRSLAVAISKHGGTSYFANKLNLPLKDCESKIGNIFEKKAIDDIYSYTSLKSEEMMVRYPYDILSDGSVKIDVKVSKPTNRGNFYSYACNIEKRNQTCDVFIIYCVDNDCQIKKTLVIPSAALHGHTQISIGNKSTWDIYENAWNIIACYAKFYKQSVRSKGVRPRSTR